MWRFAAALPFTNFAVFRFRDERGALDDLERRRFAVFRVRGAEEPVARFFRRRGPPADEPLKTRLPNASGL